MTQLHYSTPFDEEFEPAVLIGNEDITIGDAALSTAHIEADSVVVRPGGSDVGNRITLTLYVGDITIDPDVAHKVRVEPLGG